MKKSEKAALLRVHTVLIKTDAIIDDSEILNMLVYRRQYSFYKKKKTKMMVLNCLFIGHDLKKHNKYNKET